MGNQPLKKAKKVREATGIETTNSGHFPVLGVVLGITINPMDNNRFLFLISVFLFSAFHGFSQEILPTPLTENETRLIQSGEANAPMRLYLITRKEDSVLLRQHSLPVRPDTTDEVLEHFIQRLYQTVTDSANMGVGIAAPQVGLLRQIIWVQRFDKEGFPFEVYLNPKIIQYSDQKRTGMEGCLSIPVIRDSVVRSYSIVIEYDYPDGSHHIEMIEDFTAVIFQHEIDHLNGIVFTDHLKQEIADAREKEVISTKAASVREPYGYWQQQADYYMEIDMDVRSNQFDGFQRLVYTNHSPDTLKEVYFHLYFNAFQPGSMMDIRSKTLLDPDPRIGDRISRLKKKEMGFHEIQSLQQDGISILPSVEGTLLVCPLGKPILPGESSTFEMKFHSQVPIQIRRNGRDNEEGIEFSMAQWYPKMAEYDLDGWHTDPYVNREFHGVWGNFEVKISIDSSYMLGGTGYLQNPLEIGHGYENPGDKVVRPDSDKLTWHFVAPNVHDFAWTADPDYIHDRVQVPGGPELHFLHQPQTALKNWELAQDYTVRAFEIMSETFGQYPYEQFSILQGGDRGMEYPMSTIITGDRNLEGLVNVIVHEMAHSWFHGVLANNELKYHWMDEGFANYADEYIGNILFERNSLNHQYDNYIKYLRVVESGYEEAMSTHADHFYTNMAYSSAAYYKGALLLHQLSYIIGEDAFRQGMKTYFEEWKFKHPTPRDFKRVMERTSGIQLDWFFEYWVNSIKRVDYIVAPPEKVRNESKITITKRALMPMPLDVLVTLTNGEKILYYIPLEIMRGEKPVEPSFYPDAKRVVMKDWIWPQNTYDLMVPYPPAEIKSVEIDPTYRLVDIYREDNNYPRGSDPYYGR